RLHTSVYLFRDKHVGGMRVRVDSTGRRFALLCDGLSLFESQLDHCLSPLPTLIHCRSITERAIHPSLSQAGLTLALPTEAERWRSGAADSGSEARADAGSRRLQRFVRR